MPDIINPGTLQDIRFREDGTLERFVRLSAIDVADNHKWQYPLTVNALAEKRFKAPALMVMLETHAMEDFGIIRAVPPGLGQSPTEHYVFCSRYMSQTSHLAALPYQDIIDEAIVVYPDRSCLGLVTDPKFSCERGILEAVYFSGDMPKANVLIVNSYRQSVGLPTIERGIALKEHKALIKNPRPVRVTFTRMDHYLSVLRECVERWAQENSRKPSERQVYYNIDFDYFFPATLGYRQGKLFAKRILPEFEQAHLGGIVRPSYAVGCTSTDDKDNMPGVNPKMLIPVIERVNDIIGKGL